MINGFSCNTENIGEKELISLFIYLFCEQIATDRQNLSYAIWKYFVKN